MEIDFVSDVACPWCAVGLASLDRALTAIGRDLDVTLRCAPFELNPTLGADGVDAADYLKRKYGLTDAQLAANRDRLHARGADVGFAFGPRTRVWNTFDAHRVLHWAGLPGQPRGAQHALKRELLRAYHGDGRNPADEAVLAAAAQAAGLDADAARDVVRSGRHADDVRDAEAAWQAAGIDAVPAVVVDRRRLIAGAQTPEVYEQALRRIAGAG